MRSESPSNAILGAMKGLLKTNQIAVFQLFHGDVDEFERSMEILGASLGKSIFEARLMAGRRASMARHVTSSAAWFEMTS